MGSASFLGNEDIEQLLQPYLGGTPLPLDASKQFEAYLNLLLKWNARTNLTSIRHPSEIVRRHFGESIFAARQIGDSETLLDFGSGAGFPGVPIQLMRPSLGVTLAESQNKKATFLREIVRTLNLRTEVWAGRVEAMPAKRRFDVVTMRAVDHMEAAIAAAADRAAMRLAVISTAKQRVQVPDGFQLEDAVHIPGTEEGQIFVMRRLDAG